MKKLKKINGNIFLYVLMWDIIKWILIYLLQKKTNRIWRKCIFITFLRKMTPICRKAGVAERVNFYWENVAISFLCFYSATSLLFKFFSYKKFRHDDRTYIQLWVQIIEEEKIIPEKNKGKWYPQVSKELWCEIYLNLGEVFLRYVKIASFTLFCGSFCSVSLKLLNVW